MKTVYALEDPRDGEWFYAGASSNPAMRLLRHNWDARNRPSGKFHERLKAILDDGRKAIIWECEIVLDDEWEEAEQRWIKLLRDAGCPLLNRTAGGLGIVDPIEATREKMRGSQSGKRRSEEFKQRVAESMRGERNHFYGKSHSDEAKARIGKANSRPSKKKGRPASPSVWQGRLKTYVLTDPQGNEHVVGHLRVFCEEHDLTRSNLMSVLSGKLKQHKGWRIRYA